MDTEKPWDDEQRSGIVVRCAFVRDMCMSGDLSVC
jgi:hypothetical protein